MKHNWKITIIVLAMFLITQLIGLAVINFYLPEEKALPYGMEPPEEVVPMCEEITSISNIFSFEFLKCIWPFLLFIAFFTLVILLVFLLINFKSVWIMRIWFFIIVILGLGITLYALNKSLNLTYPLAIASIIALVLAYFKVFRRNIIIHNLTELMIYPGIAAVFVSILSFWAVILLLIVMSIYDMWAVWHSGIMQKMAKFQINKVGVLGGFFLPFASKKTREKIKKLKLKYKGKEIPKSIAKKQKLKVELAILGGGDIIYPIIAAGAFLKTFGSIYASLMIPLFAGIALTYLLLFSKKKKYYPAMPFITTGIFIGMIIGWLVFLI